MEVTQQVELPLREPAEDANQRAAARAVGSAHDDLGTRRQRVDVSDEHRGAPGASAEPWQFDLGNLPRRTVGHDPIYPDAALWPVLCLALLPDHQVGAFLATVAREGSD